MAAVEQLILNGEAPSSVELQAAAVPEIEQSMTTDDEKKEGKIQGKKSPEEEKKEKKEKAEQKEMKEAPEHPAEMIKAKGNKTKIKATTGNRKLSKTKTKLKTFGAAKKPGLQNAPVKKLKIKSFTAIKAEVKKP